MGRPQTSISINQSGQLTDRALNFMRRALPNTCTEIGRGRVVKTMLHCCSSPPILEICIVNAIIGIMRCIDTRRV